MNTVSQSYSQPLLERKGVDMLSEGPTDAQVARLQSIRGSPSDAWVSRRESNPRGPALRPTGVWWENER